MKRYQKTKTEELQLGLTSALLSGSLTPTRVSIKEAEVEPYKNGFKEDFKEISFD